MRKDYTHLRKAHTRTWSITYTSEENYKYFCDNYGAELAEIMKIKPDSLAPLDYYQKELEKEHSIYKIKNPEFKTVKIEKVKKLTKKEQVLQDQGAEILTLF